MDLTALYTAHNISKYFSIIFVIGILITDPVFSDSTKATDSPKSLQDELEHVDDTQSTSVDNKYIRRATVDAFESLTLTPYWDLEMGTGETVLVDCGVYTAGKPGIKITWFKTDGTIVNDTKTDRIRSMISTTNHPQDTKPAAYTVATLSIANLTLEDSGNYKCQAEDQSAENDTKAVETSIKIKVFDSAGFCGFESPSLCGWNSSSTSWRHHAGDDEESINMTKLRHDHTYGSSKHHGHMLSVDTQRDSINKPTTLDLLSPPMPPHKGNKCFEFWHICSGNIDEMRVSTRYPDPVEEVSRNKLSQTISVHQDKEWHRSLFNVTPQAWGYQILIEVDLCKDTKCKATVALDDFHIKEGVCQENATSVDKSLKARLVNGTSPREGRLEVLHDGRWGTVCSRNFGKNDSRVVCGMLNLSTDDPEFKRKAEYGRGGAKDSGEYMIWAERLACDGDEKDLGSCMSKGETWDTHNCSHDEDVAVICKEPTKPDSAPVTYPVPSSSPKQPTSTLPPTAVTPSVTTSSTSATTPPTSASSSSSSVPSSTSSSSPLPDHSHSSSTSQSKKTIKPEPPLTKSPKRTTTTVATPDPYQTEGAVSTTGLPLSHTASSGSHTGAAVGIIVALIIIALVSGIYCYKRKKYSHKSKYIVFSNPKYHKDNLPGNDISMDSPLTSSSLSILA